MSLTPALFDDISRFIVIAEHSPHADERADALKELRAIRTKLEEEVQTVEAAVRAGNNRRVEAAAIRGALTTLKRELHFIEHIEEIRTPRPGGGPLRLPCEHP